MSLLLSLGADSERGVVGGKGANLGRLIGKGFHVPEARALSVDAFSEHVAACRQAGAGDAMSAEDLRSGILARALDAAMISDLEAFCLAVGGRVSVRSSGTLEDAHSHAFAGQFATVLNVGPENVADAVRVVWASVFAQNVDAYLDRAGLDASALQMAVVIQRQIDSTASGVVIGDKDRAMIEAVFGQGEAVVSAEVESDHWDLQNGRIVAHRVARKGWRVGLPEGAPTGSLERVELPEQEREKPSLSDRQVLAVAELAGQVSAAFEGRPQDCEFSFQGDELFVLQTRDVTASLPVEPPPLEAWTPPGKGAWDLDDTHFSRPVTQLFAERFPAAMAEGFKACAQRYGALLSHIDIAFVNGFAYSRARPVGAREDATVKNPPPPFVFKILSKLVPELRRRIATAEQLWHEREWSKQAEEWEAAKETAIAAHLALQNVDLQALDDTSLAAHLREAAAHVERMVTQHHLYNLAAMIPTGDLLAHAQRWSDGQLTALDILSLLKGTSAVSADLCSPDARRLAAAVATSDEARRCLRLDDDGAAPSDVEAAQALEALCALPAEVGQSAQTFMAHREFRLTEGLDPGAPCFREMPALLWRAVREAALQASPQSDDDADAALLERCRNAIPEPHREAFDALLGEARGTYHLRDERALYSDVWAWGILRTVCLEVGTRLLRRAEPLIVDPSDAVQCTLAELESLLLTGTGPSAQELRRRSAFQHAYTVADAPPSLGPAQKPPPSPDNLPPGVRRLTEALMTVIAAALPPRVEASGDDATTLAGRPASAGTYEGVAHVVHSPADIETMPAGAVLVVGAGSSAFTMLAPMAAAVIAEGGGLLSHVAIVCREYGIPCVCGCAGVLERIQSGDRVRIDGTRGTVLLLDRD